MWGDILRRDAVSSRVTMLKLPVVDGRAHVAIASTQPRPRAESGSFRASISPDTPTLTPAPRAQYRSMKAASKGSPFNVGSRATPQEARSPHVR